MGHKRWVKNLLAALAFFWGVAGCVPPAAPEPQPTFTPFPTHGAKDGELVIIGPEEALRIDAESYAKSFGVSVEEAFKRLQYQEKIGELNHALQENEVATFGGLWIEHEPEYKVVVLFTSWGRWRIRPYLKGNPLAELVEVRGCRFTLAELESIHDQVLQELAKLEFQVSSNLDLQGNRVEVTVSDLEWFEGELERVGAQLPTGVELVVIEGEMTARDRELLLTPPVPGVVFPRQMPTEGLMACPAALMIGELRLENGCLYVYPLWSSARILPIWPPGFTLRMEGDQALVIDGKGEVVARSGEEVYMGGGGISGSPWISQQIPPKCYGEYFTACGGVRHNLPGETELYILELLEYQEHKAFFLKYATALDQQVTESVSIGGVLSWTEQHRCLHALNQWGTVTLLWPEDWSAVNEDGTIVVKDAIGQVIARLGDKLNLKGRTVPLEWEDPLYQRLFNDLPGDCTGTTWLVNGDE